MEQYKINFIKIPKNQAGRKLITFLKKRHFDTINKIMSLTGKDLLEFKNFGKKQLECLEVYLEMEGYHLKQEMPKIIKHKSFKVWLKTVYPLQYNTFIERELEYKAYRES